MILMYPLVLFSEIYSPSPSTWTSLYIHGFNSPKSTQKEGYQMGPTILWPKYEN